MEFIAMDLIGEFHPASSKGNRYTLTAICMLTGFTFCIPLKSKKAEDVVTAYLNHICCVFGTFKENTHRQWNRVQEQNVGRSVQTTKDGAQSHSNLLTTMQWTH